MFIQTEATPNPSTLKFLPGCEVTGADGGFEFKTAEEAEKASPLATRLFAHDGVAGVFLGPDFISVTKTEDKDWFEIKATVLSSILDHFTMGQPVLTSETQPSAQVTDEKTYTADEQDIVDQIKELIEVRVRPAVAQDGGDIVFDHFDDGIVFLQLRGACAGCPSATATLKSGIENMLQHYIPEVTEVRQINA